MRMLLASLVVCATGVGASQTPAPPTENDVRVVYSALRDQTEVVLALHPHPPDGATAPPGFALTFSRVSSGRAAQPSVSRSTVIDVRAYPGTTWTSKPELSFDIAGEHVEVASPVRDSLMVGGAGAGPDYLSAFTTVRVLERLGAADRVTTNALGLAFDLTADQRAAIRAFVQRLKAGEPAASK